MQLVIQNEDFFSHLDFLFSKENERLPRFYLPEGNLEGRVANRTWIDLAIFAVYQMGKHF